jgi:hypothetical protein
MGYQWDNIPHSSSTVGRYLITHFGKIEGRAYLFWLCERFLSGDTWPPTLENIWSDLGVNARKGQTLLGIFEKAHKDLILFYENIFKTFPKLCPNNLKTFYKEFKNFDESFSKHTPSNPCGSIKEEAKLSKAKLIKEKTTKKEKTDIASDEACEFPLSEKALFNEKTKEPLHFERFWQQTLKRGSKAKALAYWLTHKLDAIASTVIDAYKSQIVTEGWRGDQYTPHVITWLNGRCWENQPVQPAPFKRPAAFDDPEYDPPSYARMTTEYLKSDFPSIEAYIRWRHRQGKNFNPAVKAVYNPEEDSNLMRAG